MLKLVAFIVLTVAGFSSWWSKPEHNSQQPVKNIPEMEIYLLIGQSNMAGRAEIEQVENDTLKNVFLFTGPAEKEWEPAANPLNKYSTIRKNPEMQKLGPGYSFGKKMAEQSGGKKIGLVVNAKGGTAISEWMPGTEFYNEAVARTKQAMKSGVLKGIVWHQGESDVLASEAYPDKLRMLIQSLRNDLGDEHLPFVAGQLSEDREARKPFNQMILQIPRMIHNTAVVTSENTATFDGTHFNSTSQRIMGERYAAEMLKLIQ